MDRSRPWRGTAHRPIGRATPTAFPVLPYACGSDGADTVRQSGGIAGFASLDRNAKSGFGPEASWGGRTVIALEAQETLRIKPRHMTRIECMSGVLWITREGDLRDFIVGPGDSIEIGRGLTIALALEAATVRVVQQSLWSSLRAMLDTLRVEMRWQRSLRLVRATTVQRSIRSPLLPR